MIKLLRITGILIAVLTYFITKNKLVLPASLCVIWWISESIKGLELLANESAKTKCIGLFMGPFVWVNQASVSTEYEVMLNDVVIAKTNNLQINEVLKQDSMSVWILALEQVIAFVNATLVSTRVWLSTIGGTLFAILLAIYSLDKNYAVELIRQSSISANPGQIEQYVFLAITGILSMVLYQLPNVCKNRFEHELLKRLHQPCRGVLRLKKI